MADIYSPLPYNLFSKKALEVKFSGLDLSSDPSLLLVRQAEPGQHICQGLAQCLEDQRDPSKIKHTMSQLVSQRIYQIAERVCLMMFIMQQEVGRHRDG